MVMEEEKWFRVTDPLSPLYGCDVRGWRSQAVFGADDALVVIALRRVDVFVGDRPFQLVAREGEDLGIAVRADQLDESPLQDETIETGTDRPHGLCIDESEMSRNDGSTLRIARYERATQIAVEDNNGDLLATRTETADYRDVWEQGIIRLFETGVDVDEIAYALQEN
jgi:hypothetical protein